MVLDLTEPGERHHVALRQRPGGGRLGVPRIDIDLSLNGFYYLRQGVLPARGAVRRSSGWAGAGA